MKALKCPNCGEIWAMGTVAVSFKSTIAEALMDKEAQFKITCDACGYNSNLFKTLSECEKVLKQYEVK